MTKRELCIPCDDDSTYTRSQFAGEARVEAADTAFVGAAGTVVDRAAAGEAERDNGQDAAVEGSASEILALLVE